MRSITITLWSGLLLTTGEERTFASWADFLAWLCPPEPPPFAGKIEHPGWSPAIFRDQHRSKEALLSLSLFTVEHDAGRLSEREMGPVVTPEEASSILTALGIAHVIVTTKSHMPDAPRWRAVLLLSRDITVQERERLWLSINSLALSLKTPESTNPACYWYTTSIGAHPDAGRAIIGAGEPLDVDVTLAALPPPPVPEPPRLPPVRPVAPADMPVYARVALDHAYQNIATAPRGARHVTAAREAWAIGGLVGAGAISAHEAERTLLAATTGDHWKDERRDATRTITGQLREGARRPRSLPEARARSVVLQAAQTARITRPADIPTSSDDSPVLRPADLAAAAGELLAEGALSIGPDGALEVTQPAAAPAEDEERAALQEEGISTIDRMAELFAQLEKATRKERPALALAPAVLAWAAWLAEGSAAWETLRAGLGARAVPTRAWVRAVREHRERAWGEVIGRQPPHGPGADSRPVVVVSAEEHEANDAAVDALSAAEGVYQRGSMLVDIVRDAAPPSACRGLVRAPGAPRIRDLPAPLLRDLLTRVARWQEWQTDPKTKTRSLKPTHPPEWAVRAVHTRGAWEGIPELTGVIEWPLVRPTGDIVTTQGYDPTSGILYAPSPGADIGEQPQQLTQADALHAASQLLEVVEDFPFASEVDRSAWVASLLTPLARHAFDGPAPLFAVSANIRGAGKTRLVRIASEIVSGREPNLFGQLSGDEAEERKRITALAVGGDPLVLIDNIVGAFGGPMIDAALTSTFWSDRLLGVSANVRVPLACTWYATGNNLHFRNGCDTSRRTCLIRLDSEENPEERTGFQHADIISHVQNHRRRLLAAALTLLRAWLHARQRGACLPPEVRPWGSFEAWSEVVRGACLFAGLPDPGDARGTSDEQADEEVESMASLLLGLQELMRDRQGEHGRMTVAAISQTLIEDATRGGAPRWQRLRGALEELHTGKAHPFATRSVSLLFRRLRGRPVRGLRLDATKSHGDQEWFIRREGKGALHVV